jgi:hypothetical protein
MDIKQFIKEEVTRLRKITLLENEKKQIEKQLINEMLLNEETYRDSVDLTSNIDDLPGLKNFLDQTLRNMTQGTAYYVNSMNGNMNKFIVDDMGNKIPNPKHGKLFKHTRFLFRWQDTYNRTMERMRERGDLPSDYTPGKRSGTYEKAEGYDMVEKGKSGLYLPIMITGSEYVITEVNENGEHHIVEKNDIKKYLKQTDYSSSSGIDNKRQLILAKTHKITGGGNVWINTGINEKYMGPGESLQERFQQRNIIKEHYINPVMLANELASLGIIKDEYLDLSGKKASSSLAFMINDIMDKIEEK